MFVLDQSPGRTTIIDGREHLFFSGYAYLGMSHVPQFVALVKEGINKYGLLHPSSRISNTQLNVFGEMEATLSSLTSHEEAVIYSSGFLAGRAVVDWITLQPRECFFAPGTHPALHTPYSILLNEDWQQHLLNIMGNNSNDITVLCDSVNPLRATITDFSFLRNVPADKRLICVIDDSHGIGLLSNNGEGISKMLPKLANVEYILAYSLSKAFHIIGGAVSCSKRIAASLRASPFYTASTSIAPSLCYAFIHGQHIYHHQRKRLLENTTYLQEQFPERQQVHTHPQLPIAVLEAKYDQEFFVAHDMIISSFSYPDPSGTKINRIVLNALHTLEDIQRLSTVLAKSKP